ncbi:hypothetical protein X975_13235, partial [Stegodyphus mimosarum]
MQTFETYRIFSSGETTLPSTTEALLLAYVLFVKEEKIIQEMLFEKSLIADTKSESIFNTVKDYFKEKNIPLANSLLPLIEFLKWLVVVVGSSSF